jgi:hypothetical protein
MFDAISRFADQLRATPKPTPSESHPDADGNIAGLPAIPQDSLGRVRCPYSCRGFGAIHYHGVSDRPATHRNAHCESDKANGGYFLLRPKGTLLGQLREWWRPAPKRTHDPLAFTSERDSKPGLFGRLR